MPDRRSPYEPHGPEGESTGPLPAGEAPEPVRDWTHDLREQLAGLRLEPAREAEIVEELSQHLDDRYEALRADGTSHAEARRLVIEELREPGVFAGRMQSLAQAQTLAAIAPGAPSGGLLNGLWQDLRYASRTLRQHPGFTATIVLTLGIGIAVNATVFTLVNAAVLRPFPFEQPDRVVQLGTGALPGGGVGMLSYPDLQEWQAETTTMERVGASRQSGMTIADEDQPAARLSGAYISWTMFPLLGVQPVIGRGFVEADDRAGAPPVAILGDETWRSRYGADPGVVGRTVRISGVPATVIGIMPPGFAYPDREQLWLPLAALPEAERTSRLVTLTTFGRLRQEVSIDQARAEFAGFVAARAERYPDGPSGRAGVEVPRFSGELMVTLGLLLGAVGFVLLIACANVANLLLARAAERTRDVTLRLALGASRWRIVRQLLVESLLLAAAGGLCGLVLGHVGVRLFFNLPPDLAAPYWVQFTMDRVVFGYVALLSAGSAIVCGLVPAWHAARTSLTAALHDAGRTTAGSRTRRRWTGAFVVAQVTLALVLLTGAAIMIQSVMRVVRHDVGIDTRGLMTATIDLQPAADTPERRLLLLDQLDERLASMPQVAAALASLAPLEAGVVRRGVRLDSRSDAPADTLPRASLVYVGPRYFEVIGASAPRGLPPLADALLDDNSVIVNERFARTFFPDEPVIGRRFQVTPGERWLTITGVVTDIRQHHIRYILEGPLPGWDPGMVIYRPYSALAENPSEFGNPLGIGNPLAGGALMTILARSASGPPSGPEAAASFVVDRVREVHPDLAVFGVSTLDDVLMRQLPAQRVIGPLFATFALVALLLATCGVYAVTAYAVSHRMRELGVRIALGADARRVWWAVTGTTLRQLAIGLVLGSAGAVAVSTVLPASLFGSEGLDPLLLAGIATVLVAAGLTASAVPARRALRVDPMTTLRAE
jgi:putative ABC transport system permease protein